MAGLSKGVGAAKLFSMLEMNKHLKVRGCLRLRRTPAPTLAGNEALPLLNHHLPSSSPPQEVLPLLSELLGHIDRFGQFLSELGGLYALLARAAR